MPAARRLRYGDFIRLAEYRIDVMCLPPKRRAYLHRQHGLLLPGDERAAYLLDEFHLQPALIAGDGDAIPFPTGCNRSANK